MQTNMSWLRDATVMTALRVSALAILAAAGCVGAGSGDAPSVEPAATPPVRSGVEPVISAGYTALITHSGVFIAGRDVDDIMRNELGNDPRAAAAGTPVIDREHQAVTVDYEGMDVPRLAVMLDGLGTVLMPIGATLDDRAMLPDVDVPMPKGDPAEIAWPDGDRLSETPLPAEIDAEQLGLKQARSRHASRSKRDDAGPSLTRRRAGVPVGSGCSR